MCAHWFCCAWHLLGVAFSPSWGDGGGSDGGPQLELPLNEMAIGDAYVVSIYWAVTTMSTIGYGDIKPTNTAERLFAMFVMFVGAGIFTYGITNVVPARGAADRASTAPRRSHPSPTATAPTTIMGRREVASRRRRGGGAIRRMMYSSS